jgi:hypothetical protein
MKILNTTLIMFMVFFLSTQVSADSKADLINIHLNSSLKIMYDQGFYPVQPNELYIGKDPVRRYDYAVILARLISKTIGKLENREVIIKGDTTKALRDVPADHYAWDSICFLRDLDFIIGYPDGSFKGERSFTRFEMAAIQSRLWDRLVDIYAEHEIPFPEFERKEPVRSFKDVPVDHWSYDPVMELEEKGLLTWVEGIEFKGDSSFRFDDFTLMIATMWFILDTTNSSEPSNGDISFLISQ